jgi:tRNA threonylcarbamoyladenosine modification (KEOPS) complex Cgi121 subunit
MASKDGQVYPNNTELNLSDVFGIISRYSLLCATERRPCCSGSNRAGDWHYQNGTAVPSYGHGFAFYTSTGDDGTVRLHTNIISLMNTSQFCCELLNVNDLSQKLCISICDSDCEVVMTESVTTATTTTTVAKETQGTRVPPQMTTEIILSSTLTRQTSSNSGHVEAIIGSVVTTCAVLLCIVIVATAIVLWKFCLKAKKTQNM